MVGMNNQDPVTESESELLELLRTNPLLARQISSPVSRFGEEIAGGRLDANRSRHGSALSDAREQRMGSLLAGESRLTAAYMRSRVQGQRRPPAVQRRQLQRPLLRMC